MRSRRRALERVDRDQQLHQVLVDRRAGRLDDEDVGAADVLEDLAVDLAVAETGQRPSARAARAGTRRSPRASRGLPLPEKTLSSLFMRCFRSDPDPIGWGGRIRTSECRLQRPVPYHLATPQDSRAFVRIGFRARAHRVLGPAESEFAVSRRRARVSHGADSALGDDLAVLGDDLLFELAPRLVVQRMGDVAKRPVLPLLARHRDEQAVRALDDLDVADDETVVEDDRDEGLELVLVERERP